jgi:hypothetical protein
MEGWSAFIKLRLDCYRRKTLPVLGELTLTAGVEHGVVFVNHIRMMAANEQISFHAARHDPLFFRKCDTIRDVRRLMPATVGECLYVRVLWCSDSQSS